MSKLTPVRKRYAERENVVKTLVIKHSIMLNGYKTSVSLENEFWNGLCEIARQKQMTTSALVRAIAIGRTSDNLSSTIRVFVLNHFRKSDGQKTISHDGPGPDSYAASVTALTGG